MIQNMAEWILQHISMGPEIGLILGSGLGVLAEAFEDPVYLPYEDIPGFPAATVAGHAGRFCAGTFNGRPVLAMQGRFHYYEGKTMEEVILPVRVMAAMGVHTLILTNAAGGIDPAFSPGDLMLIEDHLNLSGASPLRGPNSETIGPRFPDMTYAYDPALRQVALQKAKALNLPLKTGVYAMMAGPNYETPAEIRMLRLLGAHAVGMSTVPEVIAAAHGGMKVLGISCITNMAAGILDQPLHHQEVMETAQNALNSMASLLGALVAALPGR